MKITTSLVIFSIFMLSSCGKKQTIKSIEEDIISGKWKVSLFQEDGVNETSDFSTYEFIFSPDGTVIASASGVSTNGSWGTSKDDDHIDFNLSLQVPLDELSDDWEVLSNTSDKIELKDISGDGSVELLTFQKI